MILYKKPGFQIGLLVTVSFFTFIYIRPKHADISLFINTPNQEHFQAEQLDQKTKNELKSDIQETIGSAKSAKSTREVTFKLENCGCERKLSFTGEAESFNQTKYTRTTCGRSAYMRGPGQKVVGFSFYGDPNTPKHKAKKYFTGIEENLSSLPVFYPGWVMRLYYDLQPGDQLLADLCHLACNNNNIDLCHVRKLPGTPMKDASKVFAMNWRFFPTLDPQVDLYVCRDLDSRFSAREQSAVSEWLDSGQPIHAMRDHPAHNTPLLGAAWGARLNQDNFRNKWRRSWDKMLIDPIMYAPRNSTGPDQTILARYIWEWGRHMSVQHDAYTCHAYPNTIGWPTKRQPGDDNFVAAVVGAGPGLWKKCPKKCRRKGHLDWDHC